MSNPKPALMRGAERGEEEQAKLRVSVSIRGGASIYNNHFTFVQKVPFRAASVE